MEEHPGDSIEAHREGQRKAWEVRSAQWGTEKCTTGEGGNAQIRIWKAKRRGNAQILTHTHTHQAEVNNKRIRRTQNNNNTSMFV